MQAELRTAAIDSLEKRIELMKNGDEDKVVEMRDASISAMETELGTLRAMNEPDKPGVQALAKDVEFRDVINHVGFNQPPQGAFADMVTDLNLQRDSEGFELPLEVFAPAEERQAPVEMRADTTTQVTLTDFDSNVVRTLDRLFQKSDASYLGFSPTNIPAGEAVAVAITGGSGGETPARGAATNAAELTYSTKKLTPKRIVTRGEYDVEGAAVWPQLQATMRRDMQNALNDAIDAQVLSQLLTDLTDPSGASTTLAHDAALGLITSGIDGKLAYQMGDVSLLVGKATNDLLYTLYRGANDTQNVLQKLSAQGARVRPSARIAAPATFDSQTNNQMAVRTLAGAGADFFWAVWANARLLVNPYSKDSEGKVTMTLTTLYALDTIRTDRLAQLAVKTA